MGDNVVGIKLGGVGRSVAGLVVGRSVAGLGVGFGSVGFSVGTFVKGCAWLGALVFCCRKDLLVEEEEEDEEEPD